MSQHKKHMSEVHEEVARAQISSSPSLENYFDITVPSGKKVRMRELNTLDELTVSGRFGKALASNPKLMLQYQYGLVARSIVQVDGETVDLQDLSTRFGLKDSKFLGKVYDHIHEVSEEEEESIKNVLIPVGMK